MLGYIDGKIPKPTTIPDPATSTPTPVYSTTPTLDEWTFRDQLARGHITLNCTDVASLGVETDGTAKEAWDSIQTEWGKSTDMQRSHAQEVLSRTIYVEGTDIHEHVKLLRARKVAVDNLSASTMSDETWRGNLIRSIPTTPKWLPVIPSLYALTTSADIVSTIFAHGMIIGRDTSNRPSTSTNSPNTALAARTNDGCTNPNCKAKKRSTHTTANCYWPGGGKEGQFPPNFGQRNKANAVTSTSTPTTSESTPTAPVAGPTNHFVLSVRVPNTPGLSGVVIEDLIVRPKGLINQGPEKADTSLTVKDLEDEPVTSIQFRAFISRGFQNLGKGEIPTFMDSGASDTMFISKEVFTDYKPITP